LLSFPHFFGIINAITGKGEWLIFPLVIFGLILYSATNKPKRTAQQRLGTKRNPRGGAYRPSEQRPSHQTRYYDDGVLSSEEALAVIRLVKYYQSIDAIAQQDLIQRMDANLIAQFNHLLNSTWNMGESSMLDYLMQQGRQGRYTGLGAFTVTLGI